LCQSSQGFTTRVLKCCPPTPPPPPTHTHTLCSVAGEYTAEKLAALQAATAKLPSKYKPAAAAAGGSDDGSFKLSGSFKALKKPHDDRFTYNYSIHGTVGTADEAAAAAAAAAGPGSNGMAAPGGAPGVRGEQQQQDEEQMPLPPPPKRPGAAAGGGGGGGSGSDHDDDEAGFALPDEDTIRSVVVVGQGGGDLGEGVVMFEGGGSPGTFQGKRLHREKVGPQAIKGGGRGTDSVCCSREHSSASQIPFRAVTQYQWAILQTSLLLSQPS